MRQKIVSKAILDQDQAQSLSDEDIVRYIWHDQISTADQLTLQAGRGVGLSSVKEEVERIGGSVAISNKKGKGVIFIFQIPMLNPNK